MCTLALGFTGVVLGKKYFNGGICKIRKDLSD